MPIFAIQPAFSRGEISPRLYSRADISHYALALKECTNFTVLRQGGLARRPGTQFISEVKDSAQRVRLIDFVFSIEQAYVLEFGNQYFRVYALGGRVENPPGTPVEVATPYTPDQIFDIQFVQSADVLYLAHPDHAPRKISRSSDTSWSISTIEFKDGPWGDVNPGTDLDATQRVLNPDFATGTEDWATTLVGGGYVRYDSSQTAIFIAISPNYEGASSTVISQQITGLTPSVMTVIHVQILGTGGAEFKVGTTDGGADVIPLRSLKAGWYSIGFSHPTTTVFITFQRVTASTADFETGIGACFLYPQAAKLLKPSARSGVVTVTAYGHAPFIPSDVGRQLRLTHMGRKAGWGTITGYTSASVVTVSVHEVFADDSPTEQWQLGAFAPSTGYPARVGFYQERLAWARTREKPQTIWFSKSAQLEQYGTSLPLEDTDGISFTILSESVNEIQWIKEGTDLLIGTKAGIRSLGPADNANAFSPTNVLQKRHVNYGAAAMQPVEIGQATLYVDRFRRGVREAMYSFESDKVIAPEVTILSEHIFKKGIADSTYAGAPMSVLWQALDNGWLGGITYEREQEMFATHKHLIGGSFGDDDFGHVESVTSIPGVDGDELWLLVKRTINGQTKRYIERMAAPFDPEEGDDPADAFFVDSGLTYSGPATNSFNGLDHLEGETVAILGDGAVYPNQVVTSGSISLPEGATVTKASIGLPFHSQIHTLDPGVSRGDGSGLGRKKKITKVMLDLYETGYLECKTASGARAEIVTFRSTGDLMDEPVPLQSGFFEVRPDGRWHDAPGEIVLFTEAPLPATIRSITNVLEPEP